MRMKNGAFEALYREYLVPLKKYAYRIGVGYDDIEDMVHEAFIEYYKALFVRSGS